MPPVEPTSIGPPPPTAGMGWRRCKTRVSRWNGCGRPSTSPGPSSTTRHSACRRPPTACWFSHTSAASARPTSTRRQEPPELACRRQQTLRKLAGHREDGVDVALGRSPVGDSRAKRNLACIDGGTKVDPPVPDDGGAKPSIELIQFGFAHVLSPVAKTDDVE